MCDLAGGVDVEGIGFGDHPPEERDADRVVRVDQGLRFEGFERLLPVLGVRHGDQRLGEVLDLLRREEDEETRFFEFLVGRLLVLLAPGLGEFEPYFDQAHFRELRGALGQLRGTFNDRRPHQFDDELGADPAVPLRGALLEVLPRRALDGLRGDAHPSHSSEGRGLGRPGVVAVGVRGGEGLQDVNIDKTRH